MAKTSGRLAALTALLLMTAAPAVGQAPPSPAPPPRLGAGYLDRSALPDSLSLIPPPPAARSPAQARDDAAAQAAVALHDGPRWAQASEDADLSFPAAPNAFACALGVPISEADTPRLFGLMRRSMADLGLSVYPTKTKYQRARPFTVNGQPQCTPAFDAVLRKDGSYPSGHAAIGWGWGLILAQAAPDRADALLARGRAFGQSRMVCNVHWQSDVEEGRMMASAVFARLNADPGFQADVAAARAEVGAARAKGLKPARDCAAEAARLAVGG